MSLIAGLEKLKKGTILAIAGDLLAIAGIAFIFLSVGLGLNLDNMNVFFVLMGAILIPFLVAIVLGILAFILWFQATGRFREVSDDLRIGRTGMVLQLAGIGLILISILVMIPMLSAVPSPQFRPEVDFPAIGVMAAGMILFMGIGGLIAIIGAILFGIMLLRLSKVEGVDRGFNTAGILYLISVVASVVFAALGSILMFVTLILIYMAADRSLKNIHADRNSVNVQ